MKITPGRTIHTKKGQDFLVTDIPYFDKFYCRDVTTREFKVVYKDEVEFVHPLAETLPFKEQCE